MLVKHHPEDIPSKEKHPLTDTPHKEKHPLTDTPHKEEHHPTDTRPIKIRKMLEDGLIHHMANIEMLHLLRTYTGVYKFLC